MTRGYRTGVSHGRHERECSDVHDHADLVAPIALHDASLVKSRGLHDGSRPVAPRIELLPSRDGHDNERLGAATLRGGRAVGATWLRWSGGREPGAFGGWPEIRHDPAPFGQSPFTAGRRIGSGGWRESRRPRSRSLIFAPRRRRP